MLIQKEQPVAFLSKALGDKHKQLSIYEKEFLALLMTVEKWRQYLQEQEFVIRTDRRRSDGWLDGCTNWVGQNSLLYRPRSFQPFTHHQLGGILVCMPHIRESNSISLGKG